mgnify:CR=1 FL=1
MTAVRAFVGHSFLSKDKDVVRCFTDYFDTLRGSLPDFDWVHATEPRPDGVPNKVLELMEGKNLFIGICTKNERVAKDGNFSKALWGGTLKVAEGELAWKTSDWIIQEIGLAIGKGMKLILLLEADVRKPGGLFGDLEYIPFSREHPEQAFQNLTGMINSVSNNGLPPETPASGGLIGVEHRDNNAEDKVEDIHRGEPDQSWNKSEYEIQHLFALFDNDEDRAKIVSDAYLASVGGADTPAGAGWQAEVLSQKIRFAKGGSLHEIEELAKANEHNSEVLLRAAQVCSHYKEVEKAKKYYHAAAHYELDPLRKIVLLGDLASLQQNGEEPKALEKIRSLIVNQDAEKAALSKLRELDNFFVDEVYKLSMMEREIQIEPSDTNRRFQLAYLHSTEGNAELALYHYLQIPVNERTSVTWNNIGVSFREFDMQVKSTAAYKKSVEEGETLAMSNLAHVYMDAGFFDEATELLSKAQSSADCHENVASAQVKLNEIKGKEEKLLSDKLENAPELSQFLGQAGNQLWQPLMENIPQSWIGETYELTASQVGGVFKATGDYVVKVSAGLGNALTGTPTTAEPIRYNVVYEGKVHGRAIVGKRTQTRVGKWTSSLFDITPSTSPFILVVLEDDRSARCMIGDQLTDFTLEP